MKIKINKKKINLILTIANVVALALAIVFGLCLPEFSKAIKPFGDYYVKVLKVIIGPMIFLSMATFVLKNEKNSKMLFGKTVLLFICMFAVTFLLTSGIVAIARPGSYFKVESVVYLNNYANFDIVAILYNLFPKTLEDLFMGKSIFFIIAFALFISWAISLTNNKKGYEVGVKVCKKVVDIVLEIVILVTPLAVISLVSNMIATYEIKALGMGLTYILVAYGLSIIAMFLVMMVPVWVYAKINPLKYIKRVAKVWLMSLSTCSSAATLPYTVRCCNEDFGVDEKITDVVVPLGCTIHMCGGAVSFALLGLFVAQLNGISVTFGMFLLMLISATLINMAAPGIPGGGVVIGFTYLSIFNFPVESFYGIYAGIYKFLDMSYTTLNVTGDISANVLLNHSEKKRLEKVENNTSII